MFKKKFLFILLLLVLGLAVISCASAFNTFNIADSFELEIAIQGNGTVEPFYNSSQTYEPNEEVDLEAIPNEGNEFISWKGNLTGTEEEQTIKMTEDMTVVAEFTGLATGELSETFLYGNENVRKPSEAGALQIIEHNGIKTLGDESGDPIQLRGMSTHGLQWYPDIINENAFAALANDWESNVIRLAMYVGEGGYAEQPETMKKKVIEGIRLAKDHDMYVIVDWHVHAPGDPRDPVYEGAKDFFIDIAENHNHPNIIYELCNEPSENSDGGEGIDNNEEGWQAVKEYAQPIVDELRDRGIENLIMVGNPNWSQRPDLAADDPIDDPDDNTIYSLHFYSGTHETAHDKTDRDNVMSNAIYALENDAPIFVSEWGVSEATGDGGPYLDEADEWLKFLNANNISWTNWSLTTKDEVSGALNPGELYVADTADFDPGSEQKWEPEELSASGEYVRSRIKGTSYEPIDRVNFSEVIWNFDDGTEQGFDVNPHSEVEDISVSNENNTLKITGLDESNDLEGIWDDARISADNWSETFNILFGETITKDIIVEDPTTVSIAAVPQNEIVEWGNPSAVQVKEEDFVSQGDGTYQASLDITLEDSPSFEQIANNPANSVMDNIVLFIATENADTIYIDNITLHGRIKDIDSMIEHDELGEPTFPSDFEDGTRQGWEWHDDSGEDGPLTVEEIDGSKALSWLTVYPDEKPDDDELWSTAPRPDLEIDNLIRGDNEKVVFDYYIAPERASEGMLEVNLAFQPPDYEHWVQSDNIYEIDLSDLDSATEVSDGLYHYEVSFDITNIQDNSGNEIEDDTDLNNMLFIFVDIESDFIGRMYMDNVRFEE